MIRKSGTRFFRKDHAPRKIWSAMTFQPKAIALQASRKLRRIVQQRETSRDNGCNVGLWTDVFDLSAN
jgi:hypothetical protein